MMLLCCSREVILIFQTGQEPLVKQFCFDRVFFPELFRASSSLASYANFHTMQRVKMHEDTFGGKSKPVHEGYEDILAHLLNSQDNETNTTYSYNELLGEAVLLMLAGV